MHAYHCPEEISVDSAVTDGAVSSHRSSTPPAVDPDNADHCRDQQVQSGPAPLQEIHDARSSVCTAQFAAATVWYSVCLPGTAMICRPCGDFAAHISLVISIPLLGYRGHTSGHNDTERRRCTTSLLVDEVFRKQKPPTLVASAGKTEPVRAYAETLSTPQSEREQHAHHHAHRGHRSRIVRGTA